MRLIRIGSEIMIYIELAILLLVVGGGSYALWDSYQVQNEAKAVQYSAYKPDADGSGYDELAADYPVDHRTEERCEYDQT